ncbi:hypothetical protein [Amycolatopsis benzoatilytica]|uniref:hypothetical protein n=1 Tax=Amycolatopsis benzoatilytica TaxID=346045 RepID=UPI00037DF0E8|nr:hypothetical protein [Amycolatopsis benzoatilytica]
MAVARRSALQELRGAIACWEQLSDVQRSFWTGVYSRQIGKMGQLTGRFRGWGQGLRLAGLIAGAVVAPLTGFSAEAGPRIAAAVFAVLAVSLGTAATVVRADQRVAVNRLYKARLLAEGWSWATGGGDYPDGPATPDSFALFIRRVEDLLLQYTARYNDLVDTGDAPAGPAGPGEQR